MNEINVAMPRVVISKYMKYRCPFRVAVENGPHVYVLINCNNFVAREDPFPVVRVFLPLIQLTHFSISLTSNFWRTLSKICT